MRKCGFQRRQIQLTRVQSCGDPLYVDIDNSNPEDADTFEANLRSVEEGRLSDEDAAGGIDLSNPPPSSSVERGSLFGPDVSEVGKQSRKNRTESEERPLYHLGLCVSVAGRNYVLEEVTVARNADDATLFAGIRRHYKARRGWKRWNLFKTPFAITYVGVRETLYRDNGGY